MSDWKNVQYKDGKMRTSEGGGGGGSSTFAGLDDVNFSNLENGQIPKYNSTTQKWENANESGGGGNVTDVTVDGVSVVNQQGVAEIPAIPDGLHHYSTTEHVIGTWVDGKPLYEKTLIYTPSALNQDIDMSALSIDTVVEFSGSFVRAMGNPYGNYDYPIIGRTEGSANNQFGFTYRYQETQKVLNIIIGGYSLAEIISVRMTIRYTKTTD